MTTFRQKEWREREKTTKGNRNSQKVWAQAVDRVGGIEYSIPMIMVYIVTIDMDYSPKDGSIV